MNKTGLLLCALIALGGCTKSDDQTTSGGDSATITASNVQVIERVVTHKLPASCADITSEQASAEARYHINWVGASVTVTVTFYYPDWSPTDPANQREWQRYIAALRVHEEGHRDIGIHRAELIKDDPANAQAIFDRTAGMDAAYDARTDGGRTQGARLRCAG